MIKKGWTHADGTMFEKIEETTIDLKHGFTYTLKNCDDITPYCIEIAIYDGEHTKTVHTMYTMTIWSGRKIIEELKSGETKVPGFNNECQII